MSAPPETPLDPRRPGTRDPGRRGHNFVLPRPSGYGRGQGRGVSQQVRERTGMQNCPECGRPAVNLIDAVDVLQCPRCGYEWPKETAHLLTARREAALTLGLVAS